MNSKELREQVDQLFTKRSSLHGLWQEIAENFYPERADFTMRRYIGTDFAANLTTSYPILCRRDLGDQLSTMLRPTAKSWFHMRPVDERREDNDAKRWLEWAERTMRRAMYDRVAQFERATKEGDHDFSAFGQCAISVEINWKSARGPHFLYRCWHLRDMVWLENEQGEICMVARRWKPTAQDLVRLFGADKVDQKVNTMIQQKRRFDEVECLHIVCDAEMYDGHAGGKPRWSIYYDCQHEKEMEVTPIWGRHYRIPRWQTASGSQYAFSPATIAALPEARLIQAMAYTLLEAGEKSVNPPLVAQTDVIRSDVQSFAGGMTWVDQEYDERGGPALRALESNNKDVPLGLEMQRDARGMLMQCFYLNKLSLPERAPEMTAYEIGQRIEEYIRGAMPIFSPMEAEYNGGLCEETFELGLRAGLFGSPFDMPESLQGTEIGFHFESPLHDAVEQQKGQKWLQGKALIADAATIDKSVLAMADWKGGLRDVLSGIGFEAKWLRTEQQVAEAERQVQRQAAEQAQLEAMAQGAETAESLSAAQKNQAEAEAVTAGV